MLMLNFWFVRSSTEREMIGNHYTSTNFLTFSSHWTYSYTKGEIKYQRIVQAAARWITRNMWTKGGEGDKIYSTTHLLLLVLRVLGDEQREGFADSTFRHVLFKLFLNGDIQSVELWKVTIAWNEHRWLQ